MQGFTIFLLLLCSLIHLKHNSSALPDTISATQSLKDGDTIVSSGGSFELGFFSPGNSPNRYVGIWYNKVSDRTVVWVANRKVPVTSKSGVLKLMYPTGNLVILDGTNGNTTVWSCPVNPARNPILQLLDSGNLVVREEDDTDPDHFLWQSFDYPTDTLLPGMKFGKDLVTGFETYLLSWKSEHDPAPGDYTYHCDPTGYPQLIMRRRSDVYFQLGSWNGFSFSGVATFRLPNNTLFTYNLVFDEKHVYYTFDLVNKSVLSKLTLSPDGVAQRWAWPNEAQGWRIFLAVPTDFCDGYARCGPYSSCSTICKCLDKFVPKDQNNWDMNDWSGGCVRRKSLDCEKGDTFQKYTDVKLPDTRSSWYNTSMTLKECEMVCSKNCSCMAYTTLDMVNGSGCLLWFGPLIDIKVLPDSGQDIYVRIAASDSARGSRFPNPRKKGVIVEVVLSFFVGMVLVGVTLLLYVRRKNRISQQENECKLNREIGPGKILACFDESYGKLASFSKQESINKRQKENLELTFFPLSTISNATRNFSINNKLGEGGFGPVYKGILEEGQEIAVKRLSKDSAQGLEEFKNEVICIAKLQHRNLVKLLGYCIDKDEMLLIYEYMPNRSLDALLFDQSQSTVLDWPKRFHIINGIARGLLYLHQDSRLRIIHRDLKASNVLLDNDMNPKISDFGLAKIFGGNEIGDNMRTVVGTYGYMSPEYATHGLFSTKSDVFSFGVMVLEMVSGKRNRGFIHQEHCHNLLGHAWRLYKEDKPLDLIDATIRGSCSVHEVLRSIQVGLLCVQHRSDDRPSMSSVVLMLGGERALPQPKQPGFFSECSTAVSTNSINDVSISLVDGR